MTNHGKTLRRLRQSASCSKVKVRTPLVIPASLRRVWRRCATIDHGLPPLRA